mmetsp:Transcript_1435/g.2044  ORF Transcript_1435/g.2044 Transcript_1435/m.2044 type:complete len:336 (+) Transcript_1435:38-1045(+)|eukprot:CAMPEP_0196583308 /NCGR_PEP_ID=MMETSP1081-20130531/42932_1 /TAXON_ID=36882 /ORGANISM="Pyramimonas amylifera, Strain CCMP720" /LENGTH=335 /DNA_ID=CAMNT_0041904147 /DNA_START=33 /DNA_END=1040 /DNA_ORIENTATION=-
MYLVEKVSKAKVEHTILARERPLLSKLLKKACAYKGCNRCVVAGAQDRAGDAMAAALKYSKQNRAKQGLPPKQLKELSQEQLTKQQAKANQEGVVTEVEMLTRDGNYRPKVSTWGMFPRPDNISKAYGGGRTLRAGEALESDAKRQERTQRLQATIAKYRQDAGLIVDDEIAKEARTNYSNGEALMADGRLEPAMDYFSKVVEGMPKKSRLFGEALLQRALCLDSLGRAEEAKEEYKALVRHPASDVARRANQMLEGFESMAFLKADQFDFMTQRNAYDVYLTEMSKDYKTGSWNSAYAGPDADEAEPLSPGVVSIIVILLFVLPFGCVAVLATK